MDALHGQPNANLTSDPQMSWVAGWLTLDRGDNAGLPGPNNPDNTNELFLSRSLLAPYGASALSVWKCPADQSQSTIGSRRYDHVRSVTMNCWVGDYDARTGQPNNASTPGFKTIKMVTEMTEPPPSRTYVMLDERADSIGNGYFLLLMDGFPDRPTALTIVDHPSNFHSGSGGLNFADGHSEIHRWRDQRSQPAYQRDVHLSPLESRA